MQPTSKRRNTTPGLGPREAASSRVTISEREEPLESTPPASASAPKRRSTQPRVEMDELAAKKTVRLSEEPAAESRPTQRRASRPTPLRVDEVGGTAMRIASRASSAPRLAKAAANAASAPLDPQSAYVMSLVDGTMTTSEIADISGFTRPQIDAILDRLMRLGLVTKP